MAEGAAEACYHVAVDGRRQAAQRHGVSWGRGHIDDVVSDQGQLGPMCAFLRGEGEEVGEEEEGEAQT